MAHRANEKSHGARGAESARREDRIAERTDDDDVAPPTTTTSSPGGSLGSFYAHGPRPFDPRARASPGAPSAETLELARHRALAAKNASLAASLAERAAAETRRTASAGREGAVPAGVRGGGARRGEGRDRNEKEPGVGPTTKIARLETPPSPRSSSTPRRSPPTARDAAARAGAGPAARDSVPVPRDSIHAPRRASAARPGRGRRRRDKRNESPVVRRR